MRHIDDLHCVSYAAQNMCKALKDTSALMLKHINHVEMRGGIPGSQGRYGSTVEMVLGRYVPAPMRYLDNCKWLQASKDQGMALCYTYVPK